eukprot:CAMPEP_0201922718 /NCGR_PEP_ID=MMETSP0903-20130614/10678_1 /ASSEMBLY_ACC=CAM_ASM_000552 /TAXON_ID=420261 /ORGANISM="Thalassiosira antarctica, Strain CCMP982" /LENGTH=60 /DNA_ID=CAMNT_0048459905 /DNA_START=35 /DNA_END=214 /DNA_ORIENTATION=-
MAVSYSWTNAACSKGENQVLSGSRVPPRPRRPCYALYDDDGGGFESRLKARHQHQGSTGG